MDIIECNKQPISKVDDLALREWLAKPGCAILVKVIRSKAQECAAKVINDSSSDTARYPNRLELAQEALRDLQRYNCFLEVLEEAINNTKDHTIAKLS